jgi:Transposase
MIIQVPVTTEVLDQNEGLCPSGKAEENKIIIEFDTRKRDYHKMFKLKRSVKIHWLNQRTFDVQELSGLAWPIRYRVTTADGYYSDAQGQRVYFTPEIGGLSTQRKVSDVVLRLGVFLCVIAGLGRRQTSWLMEVLFQVSVSKSALDRWVDEVADSLPSADEIVKLLHHQKPVTQGHFDEIFPLGTQACVLVLKDEHGRIVAAEEVEKRDEEHVKPFLERLQRLGLDLTTFYIDHCQAYVNAISVIYPQANIQFDYFHILQNIWRKVWGEFRIHRRDLKERGQRGARPSTTRRSSNAWPLNCGRIATSSSSLTTTSPRKRKRPCKKFSGRSRRCHSSVASSTRCGPSLKVRPPKLKPKLSWSS